MTTAEQTQSLTSRRDRLMLAAVLPATAVVYLRCLGNGFVFDDRADVAQNRLIGQWSFLWKSLFRDSWWFVGTSNRPQGDYYRPLQNVWLGLHYHLFGLHAAGWHATIVALHVLSVWLVFRIGIRLTGDGRTALLGALLFGLMPAHAEAVVWVSAIPIPLSAAFELGAFYFFSERTIATSGSGASVQVRNWMLALLLYALALLSHESAAAFPGLIASYAFLLESTPTTRDGGPAPAWSRFKRALVLMAPFVAEVILYLLARRSVLGFLNRAKPEEYASNGQILMTVPVIVAADLALIAIPWMADPSHRVVAVTSISPDFYLSVAALLVVAAALVLLLRNDPRRRLYLFCASWIAIAIAPTLNLRGSWVQDRYVYLASVGWCLMLADCAIRVAGRGVVLRRAVFAAMAALLLVCGAALWHVQQFWHDDVALFSRCVEKLPESASWHRLLGAALERRRDLNAAEAEFRQALSIDPKDEGALYRLAIVHMQLGRTDEAAREAAEAVKLKSHPMATDYILLARLYDSQGDRPRREAALKQAEALPEGPRAAGVARAQMKLAHGDAPGAEEILRAVTRDYPNDLLSWIELGLVLAAQKHFDDALSAFQRALKLAPADSSAHLLSAQVLHSMGRDTEALEQCRLVLAAAPDDANARALIAQLSHGTVSQPTPH